jgi:hypothetical protein
MNENVIKGPWGSPKNEESKTEKKMSLEEAREIITEVTGLSDAFLTLCQTARNTIIPDDKIAEQKHLISTWSKVELITFANDQSKHALLLQKPALAIAIYDLVARE